MAFSAFGSQTSGRLDLSALSPNPDWTELSSSSHAASQVGTSQPELSSRTANSVRAESRTESQKFSDWPQNIPSPQNSWEGFMPGGILGSSRNSGRTNQGSSRPSMPGGSGGILNSSRNSVLSERSRIESNEVFPTSKISSVPAPVLPGPSLGICNSQKNSQKGSEDLSGRSVIQRTPSHKGSPKNSTPVSGKGSPKNSTPVSSKGSPDFSKMYVERAWTHTAGQIQPMATLSPGQGTVSNKKEYRANPGQSMKPKNTPQSRSNKTSKQVSSNTTPRILPDETHNGFSPAELDAVLHEPLFESSPPDPNVHWEAAYEQMREEIQRFHRRGKAELIALKADFFNTLMLQEEAQRK